MRYAREHTHNYVFRTLNGMEFANWNANNAMKRGCCRPPKHAPNFLRVDTKVSSIWFYGEISRQRPEKNIPILMPVFFFSDPSMVVNLWTHHTIRSRWTNARISSAKMQTCCREARLEKGATRSSADISHELLRRDRVGRGGESIVHSRFESILILGNWEWMLLHLY